MPSMRLVLTSLLLLVIGASIQADAQPLGRQTQTSSSCQVSNIKKGVSGKQCDVPIPRTCKVAINAATRMHWTDIEKSPGIACRFDDQLTDWKTRITGACGTCQGRQCNAKFTVYFDCPQPDGASKAP
ncbi:MAG: hypothetical protein EPO02_08480 [Nitrospirae bacterium]|nr:MAG: hypothetical protein EPO02_08480 [Nitrospirota bacterium]